MTEWEQRAIGSVRAGKPDVEAAYMAYREPMLRSAAGTLRGLDSATLGLSAEDVVNEVIMGLLEGKIELERSHAKHLRARLRRIVINKAIDLIRTRGSESRAKMKQHSVALSDVESDVETIVLSEQAEQRMHMLTGDERYVIVENVKKDRLVKEVAAEIGCKPQNISQLRRSALRKLGATPSFTRVPLDDQQMKPAPERREERPS